MYSRAGLFHYVFRTRESVEKTTSAECEMEACIGSPLPGGNRLAAIVKWRFGIVKWRPSCVAQTIKESEIFEWSFLFFSFESWTHDGKLHFGSL